MNIPTLIVLIVLILILALVTRWLIKQHRHCKLGCIGCPYARDCKHQKYHKHNAQKKRRPQ
ncbi:MAG: FeoB-associated Cys-rich membrane protein [Eubacteriaceae bacterium]|nr:FeoB-associated Cys-rich membrane protein [Eubacteriaceae bacterium]